ncbi:TPA: uracil-DNA glycosylase [Candidatus Woesearchaeota archaeon]|nr:uracil-DNA glycosylase [Candidatus Woesearchaeota archaeon]HIG93492.1 uracil-DNA glycosylase [Candidatus Woesearchaeota archaeon]HIH13332.1 uracil-DNA glycosylase [Candidatus Woesearchaeota archaeon]
MAIEKLRQEYSRCQRCSSLCQSRTQVVFGSGNHQSEILFIGEAPGATEDKEGIPFCGMSGQILSELLHSINLSREEIFITNTILCRPENNRNPEKEEVENCRERLDQLIAIIQPKVIVTIGNFATERILKKKGITTLRGKVFPLLIAGVDIQVVPVIHPANYLYNGRNPQLLEQMKQDFQVIASIIQQKKKQKNLGEF